MRWIFALALVASCTPHCNGPHGGLCPDHAICLPDGPPGLCDPLEPICPGGERCTWFMSPGAQNGGYNRCVPDDGSGDVGVSCEFGASGYDNCKKGLVCSSAGGAGQCRAICELGSATSCGSGDACIEHPPFVSPSYLSARVGICLAICDPLTDNDFDGGGSAFTKSGTTCGSDLEHGCFGLPQLNGENAVWHCDEDVHANLSLRHRNECIFETGCADAAGRVHENSCNQGYVPLIEESTLVSTLVCVAICKPVNCYAGNCGSNDDNRLGEAPHRCTSTDRVGTFNESPDGEHCTFEWLWDSIIPLSPAKETLGFCIDHSKYGAPPCASLPDGQGSGSALGAADLGCVDSTHAGIGQAARVARGLDGLRPVGAWNP